MPSWKKFNFIGIADEVKLKIGQKIINNNNKVFDIKISKTYISLYFNL